MKTCHLPSWKRTILRISDSDYFCAPQVFYFQPHGTYATD